MNHILLILLLLPLAAFAEDSVYHNPVDGKAYHADWKQYEPSAPSESEAGHVDLKGARLLSEQRIFDENISSSDLAAFIKATEKSIASSVGTPTETFEILIDTTLSKDAKPAFQIAARGEVSGATLQKISDGLEALPDLRSRSDDLKYQVHFEIKK